MTLFAQTLLLLSLVVVLPTTLPAAEDVVEHETGFYYTVKKGDTLWDLSKRFADSPWLWPDLWGKNIEIANPHWIYPGQRIRLYKKTDVSTLAAEPEKEPPYFLFNFMDGISFIKKEPVRPTGTIVEAKGLGKMLGTGDVVYIRDHTKGTMVPGGRYTAYRLLDPVEGYRTKKTYSKKYFGIQYTPTGVVEVTAEKDGFVLARVTDSYRTMQPGDIVLPYKKRPRKIPLTESPDGLVGIVIGSVPHDNLFGDKTVAFIDKGEQDGVKPGQEYVVFYRETYSPNPNRTWKSALLPDVEFGTLLVLHAEKESATVLVTRSDESLTPGVAFRKPADTAMAGQSE